MVHAEETSLQRLLEGTKQYQVPLYQRTFSWGTAQLRRLWEDLVQLAEERGVRGRDTTHFIGSMVLAPSPDLGPAGVLDFLVVDGQQRLTALTLLLAAIRDHRSETEDPSHHERINEKYLINKWEKGRPLKLLPTQADRGSYRACIDRTSQAGDAGPIGAAYRFFRSRLVDFDDPDDELDVERLEEAVIRGLSLVSVTAQAGDNVHRIFESLNNTGLRLTQGDLIRNYLFMRLPTLGEQVYESHWLPLERILDSNQLELLFWLDLVQRDDGAKQSDTYALQSARLDRLEGEEAIAAEVERFGRLGNLLQVILDPAREGHAEVRRRLTRLNEWGTTTAYPVLLHLMERRQRGELTDNDLVEAMGVLESYLVRRLVVGKATANLNRILLRAVIEIRDRADVTDALRDYLSGRRKYFATDAEIREAVRTVSFYWSGRASQRKLVLMWLEESFDSKEPVSPEQLTVEHVLPQTPTDEWYEALDADVKNGEDLGLVYQGLVHTIGNLTLSGYNSELSNSSFEVKREQLATSGLRLNQEIARQEKWSRPQILARADRLAERIIGNWPGPSEVEQAESTPSVWLRLARVLAMVPAGAWTTYGDVATVIGTHPVPLGNRLANHPAPNAHRVLTSSGEISPGFRWLDSNRLETPREVLEAEGVRFDAEGHADPLQRLNAEELAELAGFAPDDLVPEPSSASREELEARFWTLLEANQPVGVVEGVKAVVQAWCGLGGELDSGRGADTSCFLVTSLTEKSPWPLVLYPVAGNVEVVFQHMARRPPFDDIELRQEFRRRLNTIPGIDLPAAKIALRPSFPITHLADEPVRKQLEEHLAWFFQKAMAYRSQLEQD
ncbi:MAG TPA: DUF262 domain-containing protein [Acidimicrobiales bacterium]|nr:DUF262 domain-containing protein [Acidimicrobiales bacterium]